MYIRIILTALSQCTIWGDVSKSYTPPSRFRLDSHDFDNQSSYHDNTYLCHVLLLAVSSQSITK